jgi:ABC-type phosphate transport system ATPase subunit
LGRLPAKNSFYKKKALLREVTLKAHPIKSTALMGKSNAFKSSWVLRLEPPP